MPFEQMTECGLVRLLQSSHDWIMEFNGRQHGGWRSPQDAANAAARPATGLLAWDKSTGDVPNDLLRWTPTGDSL